MALFFSGRRLVFSLVSLGCFSVLLSLYTLLYRTQAADAMLRSAAVEMGGGGPHAATAIRHHRPRDQQQLRLPDQKAIEKILAAESMSTNRDLSSRTSTGESLPASSKTVSISATNDTSSSLHLGLSSGLKTQFPDFMIIGFGKAGTRALYDALRLHPQLSGPQKEERFFSLKYGKGLNKYLSSFPARPVGGFLIEKSPDYILYSHAPPRILTAAKLVGRDTRDLRFIVITRNPIDRAMSEYLEWNNLRKLSHSPRLPQFEDMVYKDGTFHSEQPFINGSCYEQYIEMWLKSFDQSQMCYIDGDAFAKDPLPQVQKLESCMGLSPFFTADHFVYNDNKGFYCFKTSYNTQCMGGAKGRPHPPINTEVRTRLAEHFRICNSHLAQFTGFKISY